ncbi:hypothetical protein [Nocardia sp. CA-119907]|uniref:hypothetical protein n=1 Tax=Nocardia sp. CA-119907 TaxID=3239973 RepID=UPI003D9A0A2F
MDDVIHIPAKRRRWFRQCRATLTDEVPTQEDHVQVGVAPSLVLLNLIGELQ